MTYSGYNHLRRSAVTIKGNTTHCSRSLQYLLYGHNTYLNVRCICALGLENYFSLNKERHGFVKKGKNNRIIQNQTLGKRETGKYFFLFKPITSNSGPVKAGFSSTSEWDSSRVKSGLHGDASMSQSQLVVGHDQVNNYFYITLHENASTSSSSSGGTAKLEYTWLSQDHVNMYHTEVPPEFRGQGVAKILAMVTFQLNLSCCNPRITENVG